METIEILNGRIPVLGLGTWDLNGETAQNAVSSAIGMGYRHIDTAEKYENEADVGTGIRKSATPRDRIFLTTKIWAGHLAADDLKTHAAKSLERLQTDYVDLLLIHWPNDAIPLDETIRALESVQASGMTRYIGVSNFNVALMRAARETLGAAIICNQVEYHPYLSQKPVLEYVRAHDMLLTAYMPLARNRVSADAVICAIAEKHARTPRQVALRWLTQQRNVITIPKAADPAHQRENLESLAFRLDDDDMRAIHALARPDGRMLSIEYAPAWDQAA